MTVSISIMKKNFIPNFCIRTYSAFHDIDYGANGNYLRKVLIKLSDVVIGATIKLHNIDLAPPPTLMAISAYKMYL